MSWASFWCIFSRVAPPSACMSTWIARPGKIFSSCQPTICSHGKPGLIGLSLGARLADHQDPQRPVGRSCLPSLKVGGELGRGSGQTNLDPRQSRISMQPAHPGRRSDFEPGQTDQQGKIQEQQPGQPRPTQERTPRSDQDADQDHQPQHQRDQQESVSDQESIENTDQDAPPDRPRKDRPEQQEKRGKPFPDDEQQHDRAGWQNQPGDPARLHTPVLNPAPWNHPSSSSIEFPNTRGT